MLGRPKSEEPGRHDRWGFSFDGLGSLPVAASCQALKSAGVPVGGVLLSVHHLETP